MASTTSPNSVLGESRDRYCAARIKVSSSPDGTILYNRRDTHDIIHLNPATGAKKNIGTVPNAQSTGGEGGLTGLEINPKTYNSDHWLYIMHTSPSDNRIVRIKYNPTSDTLTTSTEQILLTVAAERLLGLPR